MESSTPPSAAPTSVTADEANDMRWDYIFAGGGLSASVVSHRLLQADPSLRILVIEAGGNANNDPSVVWPNSTNLIGGVYDWGYTTVGQTSLDGRTVSLPSGKGLGGGTIINSSGWVRGAKIDYDAWASAVGDQRWSYAGALPYMKKAEKFFNKTENPSQHGFNGPLAIQSVLSTNRSFPMRPYALQSWEALGVQPLPSLDANAGNPIGVGDLQENKNNGKREIASVEYSLEGITVLVNTLVAKVIIQKTKGGLEATGVQLANGTQIFGSEVIVSAGAIRTPQLLMLSGIGPKAELQKFGIPVLLDQPSVGANLADHGNLRTVWNVKNASAGWAIGSSNTLFAQPQYGFGTPTDFIVSTGVPRDGLIAAIAADEGIAPSAVPANHPLLANDQPFNEHILIYASAADGSRVSFALIHLYPTSRGNVSLASANAADAPLINPNYLATNVDRYVVREGVRLQTAFAASNQTVVGRDILGSEAGAAGFPGTLTTDSTDEYIDARVRSAIGSTYHPMGTAAMGKVVDSELNVLGVNNLRVVDASVFPVVISAHIQVATYSMAEQAADIIYAAQCGKKARS